MSLYEFIASAEMGENALDRLLAPSTSKKEGYQAPSELLRNMGDFLNTLNRVESSRRRLFELNSQIVNTSVGELGKGVPPSTIKDLYESYERSCKEVDKFDLKSASKKKNVKDDTQRKKHVKISAELIGLLNKEHDETRASVVSQAYQFVSSQETWYHESHLTLEVMKTSTDIQSSILNEDKRLLMNKSADQTDLANVLEQDSQTTQDTEVGSTSDHSTYGRKKKEKLGVYEGYLLEHRSGNDWKKRYFVLKEGGVLLGYEQDGKTLLHTIDLILTNVKVVPGNDKLFEIYSPLFNKMTLCATSNDVLKKWVALLEQAKAEKLEAQKTPPKMPESGSADGADTDTVDDDDAFVGVVLPEYDKTKLLQALWNCTEWNDKCTDCCRKCKTTTTIIIIYLIYLYLFFIRFLFYLFILFFFAYILPFNI